MSVDGAQPAPDHLGAAHQALARGAWELARAWFKQALEREETPEALEGLATAAWWQQDAAATFPARARAYQLYRARGDRRGAARVAAFHAVDYCSLRAEPAIANGWIQRARRQLDGLEPCPEHAMLALWEGHITLSVQNDTAQARGLGLQGAALARAVGALDWEMVGLALEGLTLVIEGQVAAGMSRLDEAATAAVAGEMTDLDAIGTVVCYLIYACERVRDYERAAQWCDLVKQVSARWSYRLMFSLCRTHYAGVLIWRGGWPEAEATLTAAASDLAALHPAAAAEALARLAELRRRQGRLAEAAALFETAEAQPLRRLASKYVLLGRAALALDQDDAATAADLAERFLRGVASADRIERVAGLELLVRAWTAQQRVEQASQALVELRAIVAEVPTEPLRALAKGVEGVVAAADGDHQTARQRFEDALDLFDRAGAPYEAAQARLDLAATLAALGRPTAARREARAALLALRRLGAARAAERAAALLHGLAGATPGPDRPPDRAEAGRETRYPLADAALALAGLTPREREVLALVATGRSNQAIAAELVLSVRTVERHVSTIYEKLGAHGKVARAVATAYALRQGLTEPEPR
jgi:DNA-binding NarL/FixJ family response regulator